jgi:hypothetical protein
MPKRCYRKPGDLHDLQCVLWTLIRDLEEVLYADPRPDEALSLEDRLRITHAVSQVSGSYLKVVELGAIERQMSDLEQLAHGNGHHP